MRYNFCPLCATKLNEKDIDGRFRQFCPSCDFIHYENPAPAVGAIVEHKDQILLVKRKYEPRAGFWSLPTGFIEKDETPMQGVVREVLEETGIQIKNLEPFHVSGSCNLPENPIALIIFTGDYESGTATPDDDALEAKWFHKNALPEDMAFSNHKKTLMKYVTLTNSL